MIKKFAYRFVAVLVAIVAIAAMMSPTSHATHTARTPYNWFFCKTEDHSRPPLGRGLEFTEKYSVYYIDRNAHDNDNDKDKVIYLTFDFGYENGNVAKVMAALSEHGAHGAFFVLENSIVRTPELIKQMISDGHTVCNHTLRHPDMSEISDRERFAYQLTALEQTFMSATGMPMPKYYRPPQGRFSEMNLQYLEEMGYKTVLWSFAYADWDNARQPDPEASYKNIMDHTHNGMVILLHPTSATNAQIMDRLLTGWEEQGYRFGDIAELCGDA